jgi:hypothetical protein
LEKEFAALNKFSDGKGEEEAGDERFFLKILLLTNEIHFM